MSSHIREVGCQFQDLDPEIHRCPGISQWEVVQTWSWIRSTGFYFFEMLEMLGKCQNIWIGWEVETGWKIAESLSGTRAGICFNKNLQRQLPDKPAIHCLINELLFIRSCSGCRVSWWHEQATWSSRTVQRLDMLAIIHKQGDCQNMTF